VLGAGEPVGVDFLDRDAITSSVSDNGAVTLGWQKDAASTVEVQQADDTAFSNPRTIYHGPETGTVVTGLAEGAHWFRIRLEGMPSWSPPLKVEVEFFPRKYLSLLLGVGGVVVVATLVMIIIGHFKTIRGGRQG